MVPEDSTKIQKVKTRIRISPIVTSIVASSFGFDIVVDKIGYNNLNKLIRQVTN